MPLPFMLGDKKKVLGLVFKDKPSMNSEGSEDEGKELHKREMRRLAMKEASMDIMDAFEKKDRALFMVAMKAFISCAIDEYEEKEEEMEKMEGEGD